MPQLQPCTGRHKPPVLPAELRVKTFENLAVSATSNGDAPAPPHSTLLTPLTPDHIACTWARRGLLIGGTTNNCSSANGDSLPDAGSLSFLVQSLQEVADNLSRCSFPKVSFPLQPLPFFIAQTYMKNFFSRYSHMNQTCDMLSHSSNIAKDRFQSSLGCIVATFQPGRGDLFSGSQPRSHQNDISISGDFATPSSCMAVGNLRPPPRGSPSHCIVPFRQGGMVMSWRSHSLEIINSRIKEVTRLPAWETLSTVDRKLQIKSLIDDDYPYSERMGAAYKGWLDARADIFTIWDIPTKRTKPRPPANRKGWRKPIELAPGQLELFEEHQP